MRSGGLATTWPRITDSLGIARALDPPGTLPHLARTLDADAGPSAFEAALDVEMLAVDATSFTSIRQRCEADPGRMAAAIKRIVAERGKLQNPWTGSGGVLMGRVRAVGNRYCMPELEPGELVVPLASLIAIPLRLDEVKEIDPGNPQVPVRGRAIVTGRMLCARVPDDLPEEVSLTALDVYPAASYVRAMARSGAHVLVLGAGHAGLLAIAAAHELVGRDGRVTAVDHDEAALDRAIAVASATETVQADVTVPMPILNELSRRLIPPADLTLLCTTVPGGEGTAITATASHGSVLFFSTATTFAAAGLGAEAVGSQAQLIIPNGLTDDRGDYAFDLLRRNRALLGALQPSR